MKVRKGGSEDIPLVQGKEQWLRFAGAAVKRYPTSKVRGSDKRSYPESEVGVVAKRSYPMPPGPRPRAAAGRSNPTSKEQRLCRHRRAERSDSTFKVRRSGSEEIPLVQGKEQRLHFAGAAVKRYPTSKVRETQVRQ